MQKVISRREKIILYATIGVVAASVIFKIVLVPLFDRLETLDREITLTREKIKKYTRLLGQKESLQNRYNELVSQMGATEGQRKDTLVNALRGLESLAKTANIRIIDIRPEPAGTKTNKKEVLIELKSMGTMDGYVKFIYDIDNSLLLLRIRKLELSVKGNAQNLEGTMTIAASTLLD